MNNLKKNIESIINYKSIVFQIENLELEKEEIITSDGMKGLELKEKVGKTNKVGSTVESLAMIKEKELKKIDLEIQELKRKKKRADSFLKSRFFTPQEIRYIDCKYLQDSIYSQKEISLLLKVSYSTIRNIQARLKRKTGFYL